jgi:hypothetical protein
MLGFSALSETALSELPGGAPSSVTGTSAITLDSTAAAAAVHSVAGVGAATLDSTAAATGSYTLITATGTGAVTLDSTADAAAAHGVSGAGAATLDSTPLADSAHGVGVAGAATTSFSVAADAAHGVAAAGTTTSTFSAAAVAVHLRYELRGEVRLAGILVNRRVRAYLRDDGSLVGEADTVAGKFKIHSGFEEVEHYTVAIDLDPDATDWKPPIANRVLSVLAQDV